MPQFQDRLDQEITRRTLLKAAGAGALTLALTACVGGSAGSGAANGTRYFINLATQSGDGYPSVEAAKYFGQQLNTLSGGRITVQVHLAGQLGTTQATVDSLEQGTIQMGYASSSFLATAVPQASAFSLPYLFKDRATAYRVMDGPIGQEVASDLQSKAGVRVLGMYDAGFAKYLNTKRSIRTAPDLKGLKMRVINNPITIAAYQALGATPVPLDATEVYTALQLRTIDGTEAPNAGTLNNKWYEVIKYLTNSNHLFFVEVMMINEKFFQSLPQDLQKFVIQAAAAATQKERALAQQAETDALKQMQTLASGLQVNDLDPGTADAIRALLKPVYDLAAKNFGPAFTSALLAAAQGT